MNKSVLLVLFYFMLFQGFGQFYDNGQDSFKIKWKQANTPHFKILFPKGSDSLALIYANSLEKVYPNVNATLKAKPKKLPVVLHTQTIIANGEVGWAPSRMNLFAVAPQDNYFQPWHQQLALHESRHNVQLSKLNQGTSRVMGWFFGEAWAGAIFGVHVPLWFVEGDAVAYETAASNAGRGRVADFSMPVKAQLIERGKYSYAKAIFGSYRDFVPDRYALGYQLVAYGDMRYGTELWDQVINNVARKPFFIRPFSGGLKKVSKKTEKAFYEESLDFLTEESSFNLVENIETSDDSLLTRPCNSDYVNYYNPTPVGENILSYKTSLSAIGQFVLIKPNGDEQLIFTPGYVFDNTFSYCDSILIWNEYRGSRYAHKNYSNIAVYSMKNEKLHYLQQKGRIFHTKLSPNGYALLSTEVNEQAQWNITVRDILSGKIIQQVAFDTLQPMQPAWNDAGTQVVFVGVSVQGKSLGILNLADNQISWLLKNELLEISNPKFVNHGILLKGTYKQQSNLFYYSFDNKQWELLTNATFGVGEANVLGNMVFYSNYSANGYQIVQRNMKSLRAIKPQTYTSTVLSALVRKENVVNFSSPIDSAYPVKKYSRLAHLFNLHSWAPLAIRTDKNEVGFGASLMSQNVLSTSFLSAGYQYYRATNYQEYFVNYQYKGFYPIIETQYSLFDFAYDDVDRHNLIHHISGIQQVLYHNWTFPFNLDRGKWYRRISLGLGYTYYNKKYNPDPNLILTNSEQHKLQGSIYSYQLLRTSYRDLAPKWGQSLYFQYERAPFDTVQSIQWTLFGRLYFPGILPNHSLQLYAGYQQKEDGNFPLYSRLLYPTGYYAKAYDQLTSIQADYQMPLWYPDLNVFELLYIKRLRLNVFCDYAIYNDAKLLSSQTAIGATIGFDFHAFRFIAPLDFSLTYAHKMEDNQPWFGVNFSVDFNALY
jgi:hypothetical protein